MSVFSLAPRCAPLPPGPTLFDAWRTTPGWFVVVACAALLFGGLMWHDVRWMRRAGDRGALTTWSVALAVLGYSSAIAFAALIFGVAVPLSDARLVWGNHLSAAVVNCQAAVNLYAAAVLRQGQQEKGLITVALVLLLPAYWGFILSRRFIRRAHFTKMERGLERQ